MKICVLYAICNMQCIHSQFFNSWANLNRNEAYTKLYYYLLVIFYLIFILRILVILLHILKLCVWMHNSYISSYRIKSELFLLYFFDKFVIVFQKKIYFAKKDITNEFEAFHSPMTFITVISICFNSHNYRNCNFNGRKHWQSKKEKQKINSNAYWICIHSWVGLFWMLSVIKIECNRTIDRIKRKMKSIMRITRYTLYSKCQMCQKTLDSLEHDFFDDWNWVIHFIHWI